MNELNQVNSESSIQIIVSKSRSLGLASKPEVSHYIQEAQVLNKFNVAVCGGGH